MAYKAEFSKRAEKNLQKMDRFQAKLIYNWVARNLDGCENPRGCRRELCGQICEPDFSQFEEASDDAYQQGTRGGVDEEVRKHRPQRCPHNLVSTHPRAIGKPLIANLQGYWRYEVGSYRLICDIQDNTCKVIVVKAGHRREVYR